MGSTPLYWGGPHRAPSHQRMRHFQSYLHIIIIIVVVVVAFCFSSLSSLFSLQRIDPRAISMMRPAAPAAAACWTDGESVGVNEKESIALPLSLSLSLSLPPISPLPTHSHAREQLAECRQQNRTMHPLCSKVLFHVFLAVLPAGRLICTTYSCPTVSVNIILQQKLPRRSETKPRD